MAANNSRLLSGSDKSAMGLGPLFPCLWMTVGDRVGLVYSADRTGTLDQPGFFIWLAETDRFQRNLPMFRPLLCALALTSMLLHLGVKPVMAAHDPSRWESEIQAFEKQDRNAPPASGSILFTGSSSVRLWTNLVSAFPGKPVFGRGFGGSHFSDLNHFVPRIVLPYAPKHVLVYEGDNDLAAGKTPESIQKDFESFVAAVKAKLPKARISYLAIKPSRARWGLIDKIRETNERIRKSARRFPRVDYIDTFQPMLTKEGLVREELYAPDGLHLNAKGYQVWTEVVRRKL